MKHNQDNLYPAWGGFGEKTMWRKDELYIRRRTFLIFTILSFLIPIIFFSYEAILYINFNVNCTEYLVLASRANSVEIANERLTTAIEYLEENNLTSGQSKLFISYPRNDIGKWYDNLKSAQKQLEDVNENTTELEKSNILIRLKETLTGDNGGYIICPEAIWLYPNRLIFSLINIIMIISLIIGFVAIIGVKLDCGITTLDEEDFKEYKEYLKKKLERDE